ncbi:conserved hypothetical protein [Luminiphilus syltensis NOR5-1B]|uniref:Carboxymuconolactone decarboxylase family protein n=1 Tax=Luminiphilus syltensis NOR5-1B TaxID=565045 RepID=B8KTY5_9GAMM|nr:hypothetical protein [Luminiphilus syltensis]EED35724.1 conserved hypothetical protein [Luminiphilus syltensis NOR5-1B]
MIQLPQMLYTLQPETANAYQRAMDTVLPMVDQSLLELCRAQLKAAQQRRVWAPPTEAGALELAACQLADQFAVSVDGISEQQIESLGRYLEPAAITALVNSLYLIDMALRLEQVVPVVIPHAENADAGQTTASAEAPTGDQESVTGKVIADFAATAVLADEIDALTGELVRLRCAQIHHCRMCGSLRQRSALQNGFEESMAEKVSRYEQGGFSDSVVAALHLVDTLIMTPSDADAALAAEVQQHFSPGQIAELCFDVVKWSQQKALVATHIDAPPWEGIHVLNFDEQGQPLFEGPVAEAGLA